jgi:hypothetical protein
MSCRRPAAPSPKNGCDASLRRHRKSIEIPELATNARPVATRLDRNRSRIWILSTRYATRAPNFFLTGFRVNASSLAVQFHAPYDARCGPGGEVRSSIGGHNASR